MSSSDNRLRCTMMILAWAANSKRKSRSLTASRLFLKTRGKPSSAATNFGSMGKVVPARAAAPRGETLMRRRDSCRRSMSRRPDPGGERGLEGHGNLVQGRVELEPPGLDLPADFR